MISHTGERNFVCDTCSKSFAYLSSLRQHILANHTAAKQFVCELCAETFHNIVLYARHKKLHQVKRVPTSGQTHMAGNQSEGMETVYLATDGGLVATPAEKQVTDGEQMSVHVVVNESELEAGNYENYHSFLISAAMNAEMALDGQTNNKHTYQVMCVDPDTQEVLDEGQIQGQEVIIQQKSGSDMVIRHDDTVGTIIHQA